MVLVVDGRTNTHAASPTILYRHLCICANLNSQTNAAQPVKCYYRELLRTQTRTHTHTHIWVLLTAVKQMNLCMRLTALSACGRYTKCSLSLVSSPCSKTLSLHSQYMLSCSFVLKAKQTSLFFSACIFLPIQTRRKQKKNPKKGCRHTRTRAERLPVPGFKLHRCSWGLITDVISCNFSLNFLAVQHFLSCFPIEMKKCKWMKF